MTVRRMQAPSGILRSTSESEESVESNQYRGLASQAVEVDNIRAMLIAELECAMIILLMRRFDRFVYR